MSIATLLPRWRVPLGFAAAAVALWLASPTPVTLAAGAVVAVAGEALRVWAAGHLEKGREVTSSGPYRYLRHPLYAGSTLLGLGLIIAAASLPVALVTTTYLVIMLLAAARSEEAVLRSRFGGAYDAYAAGELDDGGRRFSLDRARRNREHRAVAGLVAVLGVLTVKALVG